MIRFTLLFALLVAIIAALPAENSKRNNNESNNNAKSTTEQPEDYFNDEEQYIPLSRLNECGFLRDLFAFNSNQADNDDHHSDPNLNNKGGNDRAKQQRN